MRLLELAYIAFVILVTLSIFIIPFKLPLFKYGTIAGIILLASIHFVFEGFRWQMAPSYYLGLIILIFVFKRSNNFTSSLTKGSMYFYFLFLTFWIPITLLLPIIMPVFHLPSPNGSYQVGKIPHYLEALDSNDQNELEIIVWYPSKETKREKEPYFQNLNLLKEDLSKQYNIPSFTLSYLKEIKTNTQKNVSVYQEETKYPVILFSHDLNGTSFMFTSMIEELVSHGYILISIDYSHLSSISKTTENASFLWMEVIEFLYSLNNQSPFKETMDLKNIGVINFSFNGYTALPSMVLNEQIKAIVNIGDSHLKRIGSEISYLNLNIDDNEKSPLDKHPEGNSKYEGYTASIQGIKDLSFSDYYLYSPLFSIKDKVRPREDQRLIHYLFVQFFNKTLYGMKDTIFDNGANQYERLTISKGISEN